RQYIHQIQMPHMVAADVIVPFEVSVIIAHVPITWCLNAVDNSPVMQDWQIKTATVPGHDVGRVLFNTVKEPLDDLWLLGVRRSKRPDTKAITITKCA